MIEELRAVVEECQRVGGKWEGLAPFGFPGGVGAAFLAKHGPALIEAMRVAMEALDTIESGANSYPPSRTAREALARINEILEASNDTRTEDQSVD